MPHPHSPRRALVFQAFLKLNSEQHRPPTIRELADYLGMGRGTAHYHIESLVKDRLLGKNPGSRGLYVRQQAGKPA